jgi:hypothetical protein
MPPVRYRGIRRNAIKPLGLLVGACVAFLCWLIFDPPISYPTAPPGIEVSTLGKRVDLSSFSLAPTSGIALASIAAAAFGPTARTWNVQPLLVSDRRLRANEVDQIIAAGLPAQASLSLIVSGDGVVTERTLTARAGVAGFSVQITGQVRGGLWVIVAGDPEARMARVAVFGVPADRSVW